jgi:hypothetical protein
VQGRQNFLFVRPFSGECDERVGSWPRGNDDAMMPLNEDWGNAHEKKAFHTTPGGFNNQE